MELDAGFLLGPWRVEPSRNAIFKEGDEKHLENRVMQTLVFLAKRKGEVVLREEFFDSVWQGRVVNEEALSRAISLLRTALDDKTQSPEFIQTIPGVGYRLIADVVTANIQDEIIAPANDVIGATFQVMGSAGSVAAEQSAATRKGTRIHRIILFSLVLFIGVLMIDKFLPNPMWEPAITDAAHKQGQDQGLAEPRAMNSIAVLPFVNMSSDPEQEFLADGMTEELLHMLANVPKLRVTARTSSFFFKGRDVPIPQIAKALNVKHVLEGSIRRSGDKIRITAQLIEAETDRHLWSQSYNRDLEDIFAIQDEVAKAIVDLLIDSLEDKNIAPVSRSGSLVAFEAYRTGRLRWWRRSVAELHQAIDLFNKAIEYDPGFAPAYAALADSWMLLVMYGDMHIVKGEELAEPMINKALELDPNSAEAYAARGLSRLITGQKEDAETDLRRAIKLDGAYIPAYLWMSALYSDLGRAPEEGEVLLKAIGMDPLNELLTINYAENLQTRGDNQVAKRTLESLIRLQPEHTGLLSSLSGVLLNSGNLVAAWEVARQSYMLAPENVVVIITMAKAWMGLGEYAEADKVWRDGLQQNKTSVELKVQYLTMLLIERRTEDAKRMIRRLFGPDIEVLAEGYQRTYHYFMGLLSVVEDDYPGARDHFERVIDPIERQLFDRDQIFILTTASLINAELGEAEIAEKQLLTAERVVGHARVNGINNADFYYAASSLFALRGETELALQTLRQAYDKGFRQSWKLEMDGRLDNLRDESAFTAIQEQIEDDIELARLEVRSLLATDSQTKF